jgi:LacI family transcriptional regulator
MNFIQNCKEIMSQITIYDVAREAGVSDATVSRVFNNKDNVRETTRQRVLHAAKKLGYIANLPARSLAGGKSNIIGLLVPGLDNEYLGEIVRGIDQVLATAGFDLIVYTTRRRGNDEASYLQYIANGLTEGLLLVVPLLSPEFLATLNKLGYPYVLIDEVDPLGKSFSVIASNEQGAYDATEYLIQLGHRQIAFITGIAGMSSTNDRLAGYLKALAVYQIPVQPELIMPGDFTQNTAFEATRQLLQLPHTPTAIFASNDMMAFGVMDAIRAAGLQIPEDISVMGYDDIPQAFNTHPKLTTIRQPLEQMGQVGVQLLLEQFANPQHPPQRVTLATRLIVRDSCQPLVHR